MKNCETCIYWVKIGSDQGECRRFPPGQNGFVQTGIGTFCGEWSEKAVEVPAMKEATDFTPVQKKGKWIK